MNGDYFAVGWQILPPEPETLEWVAHALTDGMRALRDPKLKHWYQCEDTWFVGLDALTNDVSGRIAGSRPLSGAAVAFISKTAGGWPELHAGQLSAVFPGYPRPRSGETEAGFRYRLNRDAAHVDGVIGVGLPKRRFVKEPHQFILGVPLTQADAGAAPLVVWQGSHLVMKEAFKNTFQGVAESALSEFDVTEVYQAARKRVFETCQRLELHAPPGAAILLHRLTLHGVAPWQDGALADPEGRLIAYFRPPMRGGVRAWLDAP